jgi:hypothetical protein
VTVDDDRVEEEGDALGAVQQRDDEGAGEADAGAVDDEGLAAIDALVHARDGDDDEDEEDQRGAGDGEDQASVCHEGEGTGFQAWGSKPTSQP